MKASEVNKAKAVSGRYHALDALRGFAMMLGICLHSALAYMQWPLPTWPVRDLSRGLAADLFVYATHSFRMQLFFVLAGFFGCLIYRRYGAREFIRHRVKRILVPLVLSAILIQPQIQALSIYGETVERRAVAAHPELAPSFRTYLFDFDAHSEKSPRQVVADHFTSGRFLLHLTPMHLWFLQYLLLCYGLMLLLLRVFGRFSRYRESIRKRLASPYVVLWLTLLTVPVLYLMKTWQVDSESSWMPVPRVFLYYFGFFSIGWFLLGEWPTVERLGRLWKRYLLLALIALPVSGQLIAHGLPLEMTHGEMPLPAYFPWLKAVAIFAQALFTWLMVWGLFGAFQASLAQEGKVVRYLSDSAYWCYLMSLTPILIFQMVLAPLPLPGLLKFLCVNVLAIGVLLATYEWFVRYSFLGAILHGRKFRK